tara:strand:- start:151 stop:585 length:435 start_codon:yes stop_codon:yes gene_type:complete
MIKIKEINSKHSNSCYELDLKSINHWDKNQWKNELEKDYVTAMGIYFDNTILGLCVLHKIYNEAEIRYLSVHPSYKRRGLGKKLIYKIFEECKKDNINKIFLEVSLKNKQALRFYEYVGFETISIRRNYYKDGSDALIKEKKVE